MPEFFQTQMGHKFFDSTMPRLVTALERIAEATTRPQTERPAECIRDALGRVVKIMACQKDTDAVIQKDLNLLLGAMEEWGKT